MASVDRLAVEHAMRAHIGRSATMEEYDRRLPNSNLNLVLDHASRHVAGEFVLYWITGGLPEIFCLKSGSIWAIAFSERYILLTSLLRRLMLDPVSSRSIREELTERVFLKFMAEFALQQNQGEMAAQTFMKALVGQSVFLADGGVLALEHHTRNEVYMATWFYGVLHEMGHMLPHVADRFEKGGLSDENVHDALTRVLTDLRYPASYKENILHAARTNPDHLLSSSRLRSEGLADAFAATMLLETSIQVLHRAGEQFAIDRFLMEQWMMLKIITALELSRLTVQAAVSPTREVQERMALHPIAMAVRGMIVQGHLRLAVLPFLRGWRHKTRLRRADRLLEAVTQMLLRDTDTIEKGMERAMSFVLPRRAPEPALLKAFQAEARASPMFLIDSRSFLGLADSFGTRSPGLDAIRELI